MSQADAKSGNKVNFEHHKPEYLYKVSSTKCFFDNKNLIEITLWYTIILQ